MSARPVSLGSYWHILRTNRNYRLLWSAQIISEMGDWLYAVAIYSLLLDLTGVANSISVAVVLQVLPQFFIGPMAGVVNDRISRKKVMIAADLARAVIVLGMLTVQTRAGVPFLYLLLLLETLMWAFFEPGRTALTPALTNSEAELAAANGLSSMTWSVSLALGSMAGGLIAAAFGRGTVFGLNAASFLISAMLLRGIRVHETHCEAGKPLRAADLFDFSPFLEGARYVFRNPCLLATLLVKAGLGLMGAHWVFLPLMGERTFPVAPHSLGAQRGGMLGMSVLLGARGVGALLGPLIGGYWAGKDQQRLRRGILAGFAVIGTGYLALSRAPDVWIAVATVILAQAGASVVWTFSTMLLQFQTEDRFRGRVFSADFGFMTLTMAVVIAIGGSVIDLGVSVRTLAFWTGAIAIVPALLWLRAQRLWKGTNE
jgi:MFS family permease